LRYSLPSPKLAALAALRTDSEFPASHLQQMRDLEALRGLLFQRGENAFCLPQRHDLQEHARAILRTGREFLQELSSEPGQLRGALHLGVVPILNVALVHTAGLFGRCLFGHQPHGRGNFIHYDD